MPLQALITNAQIDADIELSQGTGVNAIAVFDGGDGDSTPDLVFFENVSFATKDEFYTSKAVLLSGFSVDVPISVTATGATGRTPQYEINGSGEWLSGAGTVSPDDTLRLRCDAASADGVTVTVTAVVGGTTLTWKIATGPAPTGDSKPDPFGFTLKTNQPLNTYVVSELIKPAGFDSPSTITLAQNCQYSVNAGPWSATVPRAFSPGDSLRVRVLTGNAANTTHLGYLTLGTTTGVFEVRTGFFNPPGSDESVDFFAFTDVDNADPSTTFLSMPVTVRGLGPGVLVPVSVLGVAGSNFGFQLNGTGAYQTAPGLVQNGSSVRLRLNSSSSWETPVEMSVTIGDVTDTWRVTTRAFSSNDTYPDAFDSQWEDWFDVVPGQEIIRAAFTPTGFDATTQINVANCEYRINGGAWTDAPGFLDPGQTVGLRLTASPAGGYKTILVNIGGRVGTQRFISMPATDDLTPLPFEFNDIVNAQPSQLVESNVVTVSDINQPVNLYFDDLVQPGAAGFYEFRIDRNDGNGWSTWYSDDARSVRNGDKVQLRAMAPSSAGGVSLRLRFIIGGVGAEWYVTTIGTAGVDITPNDYNFVSVTGVGASTTQTSNSIIVSGLGAGVAAPISISGGTFSKNGAAHQSTPSTVVNGDSIVVRHTASSGSNVTVTTALNMGGVVKRFSSTTVTTNLDYLPNQFRFTDVTAPEGTVVDSDVVTISGINTASTASIQPSANSINAAYRINGGSWISIPPGPSGSTGRATVQISNNQTLQLRQTISANHSIDVSIGDPSLPAGPTTRVSDNWQGLAQAANDSTPNAFDFGAVSNASPGQVYTSGIVVSGINTTANVTVSGTGSPQWSKNNSGVWTSAAGTVVNGDTVWLRGTASATAGASVLPTATIGGISGTLLITTASSQSSGVNMPTFEDGPWKVTLPINAGGALSQAGDAMEVLANGTPDLKTYDSEYFDKQADGTIMFTAPVNGARTSGSSYVRCELREMNSAGSSEFNWAMSTGGKFEATCAVLELPTITKGTQRRVVVGQCHGPNDEICRLYYYFNATSAQGELRVYDDKAGAGTNGTETSFTLRDAAGNATQIPMGAFFDYTIEVNTSGMRVTVIYNGTKYWAFSPKSNFWTAATVFYFKAGTYNAIGYEGQGVTYEGVGKSRTHFKRILNPVHPYTTTLTNAPL